MAPSANLWDLQLFREHYSAATAAPAEPHFVPVPPLGEALAYVGALIEGLRAERPSDVCVRAAWSLCTDATKLQVHEGVVSTRGAGFLAMIDEWVGRLRRLRVGEAALTQCFWRSTSGTVFVVGRPHSPDAAAAAAAAPGLTCYMGRGDAFCAPIERLRVKCPGHRRLRPDRACYSRGRATAPSQARFFALRPPPPPLLPPPPPPLLLPRRVLPATWVEETHFALRSRGCE